MKAILVYIFVLVIGLSLGWVIGMDGPTWNGLPVTFVCALLAFAINWIAFIPAWFAQTEHYYDLTGAITYLSVVVCALVLTGAPALTSLIVAGMVAVWCVRLGVMLFSRISRAGEDVRFRTIKPHFIRFLGAWTTQGLWVVMTAACAMVILTSVEPRQIDAFFIVGAVMWALGFICEVVADNQKNQFKANSDNRGKFITTGLWAWSQHPNYFGEILLWTGIAVIAIPYLQGGAWAALISPVFVAFLLTRVSGIPMLDRIAKKRWGEDPAYQDYTRRTSKLIPMPPKPAQTGAESPAP